MLKSIGEVLTLSQTFLAERKVEKPRRSAEDLLAAALKMKRLDLYLQYDRLLIEKELETMRAFLQRRSTGEPIEQIIKEVEFYGCRIEISPDVLIPRPETEILVDLAVKKIKQQPIEGKVLWDLCTGSGCIGIAIKRACPELTVVLSDICPKALAIARKNADKNQLTVELKSGDLLSPFNGLKADFVICNPPYVSSGDYNTLSPSVRDYEPKIALVGGAKGTEYYKRLEKELPRFLNPKAQVFFEIGAGSGPAIQEIFFRSFWRSFSRMKDWSGHDRFFFLEIE